MNNILELNLEHLNSLTMTYSVVYYSRCELEKFYTGSHRTLPRT